MSRVTNILQDLVELGVPSRLPDPWANVTCDGALFDLPQAASEIVSRLEARFTQPALVKAGVLIASGERPALNPLLEANRRFLRALRKKPRGKPFDMLVGSTGSLSGGWSFAQAMDDWEIRARISRERGRLFVADSAGDLAILRSLDLPAVPAAGLDSLTGKRFEEFRRALSFDDPGIKSEPERPAATEPPAPEEPLPFPVGLILVNWSLERLDAGDQPAALAVARQLLELKRNYGLPIYDVGLWKPNPQRLTALTECLRNGRKEEVARIAIDDFEEDCQLIECWNPDGNVSAGEVNVLGMPLAEVGSATGGSPRNCGPVIPPANVEAIDRLRELSRQTEDPWRANLTDHLATLSEMFSHEAASHKRSLSRGSARHAKPGRVTDALAISNQILKVAAAICP